MDKQIWEIIPDFQHMDETMELVRDYDVAFEYNDFMLPQSLDDQQGCREKIEAYKSLDRDRSKDTLHGAFLDITVHSADPLIQKVSEKRVYQCMEIARELGIRGVVFHTNFVPNYHSDSYVQGWLLRNAEFWPRVLDDFPQLEIYIENMFDQEEDLQLQLGERLSEEPRFGLCLDYAHAMVFGRPERAADWFRKTGPYVRHMHINDNDLADDLHLPLGDGEMDWDKFGELLNQYAPTASVVIEISGYEAQKKSLDFLRTKGIWKLK